MKRSSETAPGGRSGAFSPRAAPTLLARNEIPTPAAPTRNARRANDGIGMANAGFVSADLPSRRPINQDPAEASSSCVPPSGHRRAHQIVPDVRLSRISKARLIPASTTGTAPAAIRIVKELLKMASGSIHKSSG